MKCKMCGHKTDWNTSYGRENFIICPSCHRRMTNVINKFRNEDCLSETIATMVILEIGFVREERKKK